MGVGRLGSVCIGLCGLCVRRCVCVCVFSRFEVFVAVPHRVYGGWIHVTGERQWSCVSVFAFRVRSSHRIHCAGALGLANALRSNATLLSIDLNNNSIFAKGVRSLWPDGLALHLIVRLRAAHLDRCCSGWQGPGERLKGWRRQEGKQCSWARAQCCRCARGSETRKYFRPRRNQLCPLAAQRFVGRNRRSQEVVSLVGTRSQSMCGDRSG